MHPRGGYIDRNTRYEHNKIYDLYSGLDFSLCALRMSSFMTQSINAAGITHHAEGAQPALFTHHTLWRGWGEKDCYILRDLETDSSQNSFTGCLKSDEVDTFWPLNPPTTQKKKKTWGLFMAGF